MRGIQRPICWYWMMQLSSGDLLLLLLLLLLSPVPYISALSEQMYTYRLPRVHVQFICHADIRSNFSLVNTFDSYYRTILPKLSNTTLRHQLQSNSMKDIPPTKWYYNSCNISSPQVLLTMETEGWAQYSLDWNGTTEEAPPPYEDNQFQQMIMEQVTSTSLQTYMQSTVCKNMEIFRAVVEDGTNSTPESFEHDEYLEHSLILLCGGEDYIYYDDSPPDSGFLVFGLLVGLVMVGMIVGELQQFQDRPPPHPSAATGTTSSTATAASTSRRRNSRRRTRTRVDYALAPSELELV